MIEEVLAARINEYGPLDAIDQENVLAELMQHYVLVALAKAGFFREAQFHGGTCLGIIYGLPRFSEDLDFVLKKCKAEFKWEKYLESIVKDCLGEGIRFESIEKPATNTGIRKAFLKTNTIGRLLVLELPFSRHRNRKIKIKLEIDINPPAGSLFETHYLTFPRLTAITTQTIESSFASKSHALLCRSYTKGRDWYDFLWYVSRKVSPNYVLLQNAINQVGPWAGQAIEVTPDWYLKRLETRIQEIQWEEAIDDVRRFLAAAEQSTLELWSTDLFLRQLEQLDRTLLP